MIRTKIIIAGVGGVGGYFGGLLAKHYYNDEAIEINFFARGQHLEEIKKNGLKVIKGEKQFIAIPNTSTDNPIELGIANIILICTKSYDLEIVLQQLNPCIDDDTIILPLLNGIDSLEKIKNYYPNNLVLGGCVYVVSRLKQAGVIDNTGNIQTLYFGSENYNNDRLLILENILKNAGIEANLSSDISIIMWEKFIFLSPIATATSYFDKCIGEIVSHINSYEILKLLIEEVSQLARKKNIIVSKDIIEITLNKLKLLPYQTTSSMHHDIKIKKLKNELQTITTFVVNECNKLNILAPNYTKLNTELEKRN